MTRTRREVGALKIVKINYLTACAYLVRLSNRAACIHLLPSVSLVVSNTLPWIRRVLESVRAF